MSTLKKFTLSEIDTVAQEVLETVHEKVLCFSGEMGAGKTTFIKALVKHLGGEDAGNSPTSLISIVSKMKKRFLIWGSKNI